jgi:predicted ribosome quality control (RQC) complex YloA/Tae2 family protein
MKYLSLIAVLLLSGCADFAAGFSQGWNSGQYSYNPSQVAVQRQLDEDRYLWKQQFYQNAYPVQYQVQPSYIPNYY